MGYSHMLDTIIVSDLIRDPQGKVKQGIATTGEDAVCMSLIVAAETKGRQVLTLDKSVPVSGPRMGKGDSRPLPMVARDPKTPRLFFSSCSGSQGLCVSHFFLFSRIS